MKAVVIYDRVLDKTWSEVVAADANSKWIDVARAALEVSVARRRIQSVDQAGLQIEIRVATKAEIAQRLEEKRLACALRFSEFPKS